MKKIFWLAAVLVLIFLLTVLTLWRTSANQKESVADEDKIILGFSQIGAESAWRKYNSASIMRAASEKGIQLLFENAEQKQEKQIKAIRSFIAYQVDVIVFAPIVSDGWDNVLEEAHHAGIPVLVTDRKINTRNENLYAGFIGTDSVNEGREAGLFLLKKFADRIEGHSSDQEPIRILEVSGTKGSSPAVGRAKGFREVIDKNDNFEIVHSISGDFLRSKGFEIMRNLLKQNRHVDVIFSHNDGMALGMIDALKEENVIPGQDVVIISIDAEQAAIDALKRGEINCVIECNPRMGPDIVSLAEQLALGKSIPRHQHVEDQVFTEFDDLSSLEPRGY